MGKGIKKEDNVLAFRSHVKNLFEEILSNDNMWVMKQPLGITLNILRDAANYAAELGDEKMIGYFVRLALYTFSDPTHPDYDKERTMSYISNTVIKKPEICPNCGNPITEKTRINQYVCKKCDSESDTDF